MAYSLQLWIDAHTAARTRILGGAGASTIKIKSAAGTVLAEVTIDEADTEVDVLSGDLDISVDVQEDSAVAGAAAITDICDGDGVVHGGFPMQAGTSAVAGYAVMNTLNIVGGQLVDVLSVRISPPVGGVIEE